MRVMPDLRYAVVDAFASEPFTGNPAAVVFDADELEDKAMQAIASEFNLSETTFVLRPRRADAAVRFRWFTPGVEVSMCGHATLAAVHALVEDGQCDALREDASAALRIESLGGSLLAGMEAVDADAGEWLTWIVLVPPTLTPREINTDKLAELLRTTPDAWEPDCPTVVTQDQDLIIVVRDFVRLNELKPDFQLLAHWCSRQRLRGLCVATMRTLAPAIHVQSRFFAPAAGVDEDPVTGSVHGPLAAYLVQQGLAELSDGFAHLRCVQAKAGGRAGSLHAIVSPRDGGGYDVRLAGRCFTTMRGSIHVE